jgi:membrane-bound inhibitor of C-type lysozyme
MKNKNITVTILAFIAVIGAGIWYASKPPAAPTTTKPISQMIAKVSYLCRDGKGITASYSKGEPVAVKPGERPVPNESVSLVLSDSRQLTLPETISASGIRYANGDESFIFWSKGNGAFVMENNNQTYAGCVALVPDTGGLSKTYADGTAGFSIRYPEDYSIDMNYRYQALGPGKEIGGVKFTIPASIATGTNLSSYDTGVSVEEIPSTPIPECKASLFTGFPAKEGIITDNGVEYSYATTSDAGAGNFYEEAVWAVPGINHCVAVRYLIHSMNIGNYPSGAVRVFDRQALLDQFDNIRRSLLIAP